MKYFVLVLLFCSCKQKDKPGNNLFSLLPASETNIEFRNDIVFTESFNPYTFRNFFNGGGVAIGDINNDGLPDIFFSSNQQSNKLYLNRGNFRFEDITDKAGLNSEGVWSTGVTFADVNGDGWLDIYVCKSGDLKGKNRSNELFINNAVPSSKKNGAEVTFTEKAEDFGLNSRGLSTHAVFFDYDNDNDLDCYVLNNSFRSVGNYDLVKDQRMIADTLGGNKLYRNDEHHFADITTQAGIYSSNIGFGLGVSISDINKDGWQDIYVSNDFFERDYLYINKHDGSFNESLEKYIRELSMNSMGADIADINNDGYPEIYVTDMFPETDARIKTKTFFEDWDKYQSNIRNGYYKQFVRNTLQLNRGPVYREKPDEVYFSEISRFANVNATDWSWGALITDLDNDGNKDIFVANGIYKDITDQDYIQYANAAYADIRKQILNKEKNVIKKLIDVIPSEPIPNYAFKNNGDLTFLNKAKEWGLDKPGFSNGSAYGDLDNDGDLDLVVNNVNMPCFVYRNETTSQHNEHRFLKVSLAGEGRNRFGTGAKVTVYYNNQVAYQEQMPMRGFESTVDNRLNFGLGKTDKIDSVIVIWPDGRTNFLKDVPPDQHIIVMQREAKLVESKMQRQVQATAIFKQEQGNYGLDFTHTENEYVDFDRDRLLFQMLSTQGPRIAKGDVNKDGLEDIYIGGAQDQPGALYIQSKSGRFSKSNEALFDNDKVSEDTDALFFDADKDGDEDLYVCSGGNEFSPNSTALINRLYINDGKGIFSKSPQVLPSFIFESTSCVSAADYDNDGDMDLLVGVRLIPFQYGVPCKAYILQNNGSGIFMDVTEKLAPALKQAGMTTDGEWLDYDKDGFTDLVIAGEYMPLRVFHNDKGSQLTEVTKTAGLSLSHGWWNRLAVADINNDGYPDIVAGNHGLNSRFKASHAKPVNMYVGDFDNNGTVEPVVTCYNRDSSYPMVLRHDLVSMLPYLKKKYLKYENYREETITDIFTPTQLENATKLSAYMMQSCVFINNKKGGFIAKPLPAEAQLSPVFGIAVNDFDRDGKADILLGGNFQQSKPEVGIYDASYGMFLKGDGTGNFAALKPAQSGFFSIGAVRDITLLSVGKKQLALVVKNNDRIHFVSY